MKGRFRYRNMINRDSKFSGHTNQSTILKSGYTVHQTWKGLSKAWLGYNIVVNKNECEGVVYYASVIQKLQQELGLPRTSFPNIETDEVITKENKNFGKKKTTKAAKIG